MSKFFIIILFAFISSNIFAQWSSTNGPGGGTITEFYATDEKLFTATGANAGGVYCSTDEGANWEIKNRGLALQSSVNTVYGDSSYIYAGLSQFGVFRSDNLGETWTAANNGISESGLWINDIYEADGVLYAAALFEGIYISSNQGDSWTFKSNGLEGAAKRVAEITKLNNTLFLATPLGVYKSENNGDQWNPSSNGIPDDKTYSSDIVTKDNLLFVAALDGIYRSDDEGLNWTGVGVGLFISGVYTIYVYEDYIYAGTNGKMYQSADDGDSWTEIGSGISPYAYIYAIHASADDLICGVNVKGIFKYNAETEIWSQSNSGLINENVTTFMLDGQNIFAGTLRSDFGQIFKTENNGNNWSLSNNGAWDGGYHALMNAGDYYLAGTDGGFIYRSTDKGNNWVNILYPDFQATYVSSFCEKDEVVFAASFGNTIDTYRSVNDGILWEGCDLPGQGNVMALIATDEYVYSGRTDGVYRSADLGISWVHTSNGLGQTPFIKRFAENEDYLFAVALDGLYRSDNDGDDWEKVYSPPFSNGIESIATHEHFLFAGTKETGLIYSEDNGESWKDDNPDYFQDPSGTYPTVLAIVVKGDSLYVSYRNFSAWVRPLPNITGVNENIKPEEEIVHSFTFYPNPVKEQATVKYSINQAQQVRFSLYDLLGNELNVSENGPKSAGEHTTTIKTSNLKPGVYMLAMKAGNHTSFQKLLIVK